LQYALRNNRAIIVAAAGALPSPVSFIVF